MYEYTQVHCVVLSIYIIIYDGVSHTLHIVFLSVPSTSGVASAQGGENTDTSLVEPPTDLDFSVKNVGQDVEFQLSNSFDETIRVASQILRMFFTRCVF